VTFSSNEVSGGSVPLFYANKPQVREAEILKCMSSVNFVILHPSNNVNVLSFFDG
jgi:hypothetical protein